GDIAEWYDVSDGQVGDIVVTTNETITYTSPAVNAATGEILNTKQHLTASVLEQSSKPYQSNILGVISTSPYETFGKSAIDASDNPNPVALIGRVEVSVSGANGAILPGDPITTSDMRGVGMKATKPGFIVGRALEPYSGTDPLEIKKILVFINISWFEPESYTATLESLISDYQNGILGGGGSTGSLTGGWSFDGSIISTPAEVAASSFTGTSGTFSILRSQTITIGGDTFIVDPEGNVDVAGDIVLAGVLSGRYGDLTIKLNDTDGTSKFRVTNAEDKEVFSVSSTGKIGVTEDVKGESDNAVAGTASIEKGKNSLVIETTQITSQSKIQITFRSDYTPATRYWISDRTEGERFTVSLNADVAQDSTFDWWIIN
ncbi:MAG: hypothetical protein PHG63_04105, partial [Candidatus Dojkabacteria bacterium]|nr:hypothetical protein [Candidatus Dojkabacteria bacterium]